MVAKNFYPFWRKKIKSKSYKEYSKPLFFGQGFLFQDVITTLNSSLSMTFDFYYNSPINPPPKVKQKKIPTSEIIQCLRKKHQSNALTTYKREIDCFNLMFLNNWQRWQRRQFSDALRDEKRTSQYYYLQFRYSSATSTH